MATRSKEAGSSSSLYYRWRFVVFGCFLAVTPFVVYAAHLAVESNSNNVADWLPESFQETQDLEWFGEHFGTDAILMISWEGCTLDDPRPAALASELRLPAKLDAARSAVLFRQVITGGEILKTLRGPPLELSQAAAVQRLQGWILGPDAETTCIVAVVSDDGWRYRHSLSQHIDDCVGRVPELAGTTIHAAGSVLDSVEIDNASNEGLLPLSLASYGLCFLLMYLLLRNLVLSGIVFINAMFCQQLGLAVVYASGTQMDSVLLMVPMLVFVLAVSAGIHLVNYYRDTVIERGLPGAPLRAMHDAWAPCWLASGTTALGLISLMVSQLVPVQKFGFFASIMILLGTLVLFTLLPCQLEQSRPTVAMPRRRGEPVWVNVLQRAVYGNRYVILLAGIAMTIFGGYGIANLQAGVRLHDMFKPGAKILRDYDWLEKSVGPLVPFELVLRLPKDNQPETRSPMLKRLQLVNAVHWAAAGTDGIGAVVSASNFCPSLHGLDTPGTRQVVRRAVINKKLEASRSEYLELGFLRETATEELWRVSGRAYAGQDVGYARILADLKERVQPILADADAHDFAGIQAVYCGGIPLVQKAQQQMLDDLIKSFLVAFGLIACVMAVLMIGLSVSELHSSHRSLRDVSLPRSVLAGLLAMLPNLLPCVIVLGGMGLAGMRIEIGSMMTASVALGIAVDDTLHFLTWFRRGLGLRHSRRGAVSFAYQKCGAAMVQTSVICGVGLLVYSLSPFVPIARFSWVMTSMLAAALLSDLLFLPAMLLSPLGAVFEPSPATQTQITSGQLKRAAH